MGSKRAIYPGIQTWDNVKLAEEWAEFKWYLAREGFYRYDQLTEADQAVYELFHNELCRRGLRLSGAYGRERR